MSSQDLKQKAESQPEDIQSPTKQVKPSTAEGESDDEFFSCRDTENSAVSSPKLEAAQANPKSEIEVKEADAALPVPAAVVSEPVEEMKTEVEVRDTVGEETKSESASVPVVEPQPGTGSQPAPVLVADSKTISECETTASETKTPASAGTEASH